MINKRFLILKNITREGPGLLAEALEEQNACFDLIDLEHGDHLPDITPYSGLVVLGGPDSANDQSLKIISELAYIKAAVDIGKPYLGICLGLQLLVKAFGGQVVKSEEPEIGFYSPNGKQYSIELCAAGQIDQLFAGLQSPFPVFQLHGETVVITKSMTLLGVGDICKNQIVKVGSRAYGIQCHFELTDELFDMWCREDADLMALDSVGLRRDFDSIKAIYISTGKTLMNNFILSCS